MIESAAPTYYELLGVPTGATDDEIRAAFSRAVSRLEADGPGAAAAAKAQLTEAMEILTDPDLRQEYDRITRPKPPPAKAAPVAEAPAAPEPVQLAMDEVLAGTEASHPPPPTTSVPYVRRITREIPIVGLPEEPRPEGPAPAAVGSPAAAGPPGSEPGTPAAAAQSPALRSREPVGVQPLPVEPSAAHGATVDKSRISAREFELAQRLVEETAIANAEAALARVAAKVREVKAEQPRPRSLDIPADAAFNGELLRKVREARGQTLKQLADKTRISTRHLENIEADRYDDLPAPVYLRGILMNLARELRLDPLRVARSYLELVTGGARRSN